jgi:hypothetical protein
MARDKQKSKGQYLQLWHELLKSPAWRSLSGPAIKVFLELAARFNGGNNGRLLLPYEDAKRNLGLGKTTVMRAFRELERKGFVLRVKPGNWYFRQAHEWAITIKPLQDEISARNTWRYWSPEKQDVGPKAER